MNAMLMLGFGQGLISAEVGGNNGDWNQNKTYSCILMLLSECSKRSYCDS